jgi:putative transposase
MYHVTTHAVANSWLFLERSDYESRLSIFADAVEDGWMRCHAFCLMGNHDHLLVTVAENRLALLMQRMNRRYAGTFNQEHGRDGRLYRAPYRSVLVVSEGHTLEVVRYIALNPEQVGGPAAEEYEWSSYPGLVGLRRPFGFVDPTPLLDAVGGGQRARGRIARFVADGRRLKRAL